jgi:hypothetical protein
MLILLYGRAISTKWRPGSSRQLRQIGTAGVRALRLHGFFPTCGETDAGGGRPRSDDNTRPHMLECGYERDPAKSNTDD